jgi:hypothetical protein
VGDKVLHNAKNLIPSFEDAKWSLHANAKVLGKDVLRFEPPSSFLFNVLPLDLKPNTQYLFVIDKGAYAIISDLNNVNSNIVTTGTQGTRIITTSSNINNLCVRLTSGSAGTFDFIKPQLYQLDGKEGTLVGNPTKLRKASKRTLYSKR